MNWHGEAWNEETTTKKRSCEADVVLASGYVAS